MAIKNVVEGLERQLSSRKEQLDERR
jgi:hypothetical protein